MKLRYAFILCLLVIVSFSCTLEKIETVKKEDLDKYLTADIYPLIGSGLLKKDINYVLGDSQLLRLKKNTPVYYEIGEKSYPFIVSIDGVQKIKINNNICKIKHVKIKYCDGFCGDVLLNEFNLPYHVYLAKPAKITVGGKEYVFMEAKYIKEADIYRFLEFYNNGSVEKGYLGKDMKIFDIVIPKGSYISFRENGSVRGICLMKQSKNGDELLPKDTYIVVDEKGNVIIEKPEPE